MSPKPIVPRRIVRLGLRLAAILPPRLAYGLCTLIAAMLCRLRRRMFVVLRGNLGPVAPERSAAELDKMAKQALALALRTYYEMLRSATHEGKLAFTMAVPDDCPLLRWIASGDADGPGLMVCGLHMSNFDLAGAWLAHQGAHVQVLSLANPDPGTALVNALREKQGLIMTPIEPATLRAAIRRLKAGGMVLTGIDRPMPEGGLALPFFGQTAQMPVGHIRLALQADARILLVACLAEQPGHYRLVCSEPITLTRTGDREQDVALNARATLALAEELIRRAPEQWLVFVPVWPPQAQPETSRNKS